MLLIIHQLSQQNFLEYVGTDNPVLVFQANLGFILQENMSIHYIEK